MSLSHSVILFGLAAMLLVFDFPGEAQQSGKVARVGYLSNINPATESSRSEAIRFGLRELGYLENIKIEYRYAEGKRERFPELAAELVRLNVDIILVTGGDLVIQAVKNATKTIPIVMLGQGLDPVEAGLIESLARPGGNITGLTNLSRGARRKAAGTPERSRYQSWAYRSSLRSD